MRPGLGDTRTNTGSGFCYVGCYLDYDKDFCRK